MPQSITDTNAGKYARIYALVNLIPAGKVATYGQLAKLAGFTARQVGYAMAATPKEQGIPWYRVINSQGKLSLRADGQPSYRQFERLQAEGLPMASPSARIDLSQFQWDGVQAILDNEEPLDEPLDLPGLG